MQNPAELTTEASQEDPVKAALEIKKLTLEIADLERPWWKRPTYILAALPTLLAMIALSVGVLNGFFSAQLTKLENQKHDLQSQVREFEEKRDELHREYLKTQQELTQTKQQLNNAEKEMAEARNQYVRLAALLKVDSANLRRVFNTVSIGVR